MAKDTFHLQFFWKVKPENITIFLQVLLHQPDMCYIKQGSHSRPVQATENKTKSQTDWSRLPTFFKLLWQRLVQNHHLGFFNPSDKKCSCTLLLPKETIYTSAYSNMREHQDRNWMDKQDETKIKAQKNLKLRLLSKAYCSSPVLLVSYKEQKERQDLFLQLNRERKA